MYINATHLEIMSIFTSTLQLESFDSGAYTIRRRGHILEAIFSNGSIIELVEIREHDGLYSLSGYRLISYDSDCTVIKDNFYRLL
jgi:hypothetical protein